MDKDYKLLSFLIQGVKSILSNESNLFTIRGISDSDKNEESNIYAMFSEVLLASTWNAVSSEIISRCIFRIINEKVSADKQLHSLAIDKIPGTEEIKVPKNYIQLRISFTTVTVKQILKEKPKMIEEKEIVAMVTFKEQRDVVNGKSFLRCTDECFSGLFKNGTVVTGILKQRAVEKSKLGKVQSIKNTNESLDVTSNLCFSKALLALKDGFKITRSHWTFNDKKLYVKLLVTHAPHPDSLTAFTDIQECVMNPYFKMADNNNFADGTLTSFMVVKTTDNIISPWTPDQADVLASDWVIIPK